MADQTDSPFALAVNALSDTLNNHGVTAPLSVRETAAAHILTAVGYATLKVQMEGARERHKNLADRVSALRIMPRSVESLILPGVHTPTRIRSYLRANGWTLSQEVPGISHWVNSGITRPGWAHAGSVVTLYSDSGWPDYANRAAGLVVDLASLHEVGELQVLADIAGAGRG